MQQQWYVHEATHCTQCEKSTISATQREFVHNVEKTNQNLFTIQNSRFWIRAHVQQNFPTATFH